MVSFVFLTKFILVKYHTSSLHTIQTLIQLVDRSVLYIPCKTAETSDLAIFAPSVAQSQKAALGSYLGRMYGTTSGFVIIIIMTVIFSFLSSETERKKAGSREDSFLSDPFPSFLSFCLVFGQ